MKIIPLILMCCYLSVAIAQQKKQRQFKAYSNPYKIYVTPNNTIWVTSKQSGYFINYNPKRANWDIINHRYSFFLFITKPTILFFNDSIGIIHNNGDSAFTGDANHDTYYRTIDGGTVWEEYTYDSLARTNRYKFMEIYTNFGNSSGQIWSVSSNTHAYYSDDYGLTWCHLPHLHNKIIHDICMSSSKDGIAGGNFNQIWTTDDNWQTLQTIPSPRKQRKYITPNNRTKDPVSRVATWGDYFVVQQDNQLFYSKKSSIDWHPFPATCTNFTIDPKTKLLYTIHEDTCWKVSTHQPDSFIFHQKEPRQEHIIATTVQNDIIYILYYDYKVAIMSTHNYTILEPPFNSYPPLEKKKKSSSFFSTSDWKTTTNETTTWGYTTEALYVLEDSITNDWRALTGIKESPRSLYPMGDSAVIIQCDPNNYYYHLGQDTLIIFEYSYPLQGFLDTTIQTFSFDLDAYNDIKKLMESMGYFSKDMQYQFIPSRLHTVPEWSETPLPTYWTLLEDKTKKINATQLTQLLEQMNNAPNALPSIKQLNITPKDKRAYTQLITQLAGDTILCDSLTGKDSIDTHFYFNVLNQLDTLSGQNLKQALNYSYYSLVDYMHNPPSISESKITNEQGDTLFIQHTKYNDFYGWNLNPIISYKGKRFRYYNPVFSRFLCRHFYEKNLPNQAASNNVALLLQLANYLSRPKKEYPWGI